MSEMSTFVDPGMQGSIEWLVARTGYTTASRFGAVMDKLKSGKPGAKRETYLWEKVIERISGNMVTHFESAAMIWGSEHEAEARAQYEARTGALVEETGFVHHQSIEWVGGSCDGTIDSDGLIEIKNPYNSANHLQCFLSGFPIDHKAQCQGLLWIMEREWIDCISYDCRMPEPLNLFIERQQRDDDYIAELHAEILNFNSDVTALVSALRAKAAK